MEGLLPEREQPGDRLPGLRDAGARFVFGDGFAEHFFAFKVLPTIIFFSALMAVLYHLGVMQWVVAGMAWVMMRRSWAPRGAESLSAAANIFVGQTEAPLLIRPYIADDDAVRADGGDDRRLRHRRRRRAGGLRRHAAGVADIAGHLLAASVMSAPAALVIAKIMLPETEARADRRRGRGRRRAHRRST